ncbi:MAG: IS66 family transposase, partial [Candidatus Scalindua sp.]
KVANYQALIKKLQRMLFGSKRERFVSEPVAENQLNLSFEELVDKNTSDLPVKDVVEKRKPRKRNHKGRKPLPKDLPEEVIVIEPEESTEGLVQIGEERTEILERIPAKFLKIVIIRPKYAKANGEGVLIADMPSRPIEKCIAGNGLLAQILIGKYVDHLPLYRQLQMFKRSDIDISSSTIGDWIKGLGTLLEPLYDAMVNTVKNDSYIQADETPTKVLDKQKKGKTHLGYHWVYHSPLKRMVVFDYQKGRSKEAPRSMLDEFKGYLQTDGYKVYTSYGSKPEVTHLGCWAHARRYFDQALDQDNARASYALEKIKEIYLIERELKESSASERKEGRLNKSLPIINELGKWISQENRQILPKSSIGKAFTYAINIWDSLQHYLYNGDLLIDNNLIENSIRPNALGRKNYLFAGSHEGAQRTAMFYSFLGTCKMQGVNPEKWLQQVLSKISDHKVNKLYELFPGNLELSDQDSYL